MLVNRIHSQLHAVGLVLPREQLLRRATRTWLRETAGPVLRPEQRRLVASHWHLIRRLTRLLQQLDAVIAVAAAADPAAMLLATIPGIGAYRGLLLATELLPMTRYASAGKFVGYAGLAPITQRSADRVHHGPLPNAANRWVRGALISSIPTHLRCAPTSPLSQYYARQKARLGWQIARVATARQLARVIYRMLRTGEEWRPRPSRRRSPRRSPRRSRSRGRRMSHVVPPGWAERREVTAALGVPSPSRCLVSSDCAGPSSHEVILSSELA